jgi:Asp-tRNA(Asn)/Glu-tRNA(Gln) amidotransferase B subunit
MKYRHEVISETDTMVFGKTFVQMSDDGSWDFASEFYKSKTDQWFIGKPQAVLARIGITTTPARADELADLMDGDVGGFYFVARASDGTDEAIKWIMGSLAAVLNERGLPFSKVHQVLPADYLNAFINYLTTGKFEKSFAKEIFTALIAAPVWVDDGIWEEPSGLVSLLEWDEHQVAVAAIDSRRAKGYENPVSPTAGFRRVSAEERLDEIIANPRFKAVDESEIDSIIEGIIVANPDQAAKVAEKPALLQWFLGQVLKASKGRAPPQVVKSKLEQRLL